MTQLVDLIFAIVGLGMMAIGLWWINPGASLTVVGGTVFACSVIAASLRRNKPDA